MKFTQKLKLGEVLKARVVEEVSAKELIVDFKGDLMRVSNASNYDIRVGQEVFLRVIGLNPVSFQIATSGKSPRGYNLRV